MGITAKFPAGATEITVHGLHQWDRGRALSIVSDVLSGLGLVEVHFASQGMNEAIVRVCTVTDDIATTAIPDICLEQDATLSVWVYCNSTTEGLTILQVTMPIVARTRPSTHASDPPSEYTDQYTELLTAARQIVNAMAEVINTASEIDENTDEAMSAAQEAQRLAQEARDTASALQTSFNNLLNGTSGSVGTADVAGKLKAYKADLSLSVEDTKKVLLDLSSQAPLSLGLIALTFQVQWGSVMYQTCAAIPIAQGGFTDYTIVARDDDRFIFTVSEQNGKIYIQRSVGFNKASPGTVIVYYARYIRLEPTTL